MSVHYFVYVGPYLAVPHTIQHVTSVSYAQCAFNADHTVDKNMSFCPHCGTSLRVIKREDLTPTSIRVQDIANVEGLVWQPEGVVFRDSVGTKCDVWISNNVSTTGGQYCGMQGGEIIHTLENSKKFSNEIVKFSTALNYAINEIQERYFVEVTVHHGIVVYWS